MEIVARTLVPFILALTYILPSFSSRTVMEPNIFEILTFDRFMHSVREQHVLHLMAIFVYSPMHRGGSGTDDCRVG
jgi:hypothetical protein